MIIIAFEGVKGTGMTLSSVALVCRKFLAGKRVVSGYKLQPGSKYRRLTKEELIKEIGKE